MEPSPHPTGCKCSLCFGFAEYMEQATGKDYGLARAPGCERTHKLRVLTFGTPDKDTLVAVSEPECDGSMVCSCRDCCAARVERAKVVALRRGEPADPLRPRAPRFAAARLREAA